MKKYSETNLSESIQSTNRLLSVIALLLIRVPIDKERPLREQINLLHHAGLRPAEIAKLLNRSNTYVNKEIFELKKLKKLGGKNGNQGTKT